MPVSMYMLYSATYDFVCVGPGLLEVTLYVHDFGLFLGPEASLSFS